MHVPLETLPEPSGLDVVVYLYNADFVTLKNKGVEVFSCYDVSSHTKVQFPLHRLARNFLV